MDGANLLVYKSVGSRPGTPCTDLVYSGEEFGLPGIRTEGPQAYAPLRAPANFEEAPDPAMHATIPIAGFFLVLRPRRLVRDNSAPLSRTNPFGELLLETWQVIILYDDAITE